jgi:hypothetical protein
MEAAGSSETLATAYICTVLTPVSIIVIIIIIIIIIIEPQQP